MRHITFLTLCLGGALALSGCDQPMNQAEVERAVANVNVVDESGLNDVMLASGDPNEAVAYFQRSLAKNPDRVDLKRDLASSLVRAGKPTEAAKIWAEVAASDEATSEDRIAEADALIRAGDWDKAGDVLDQIPPTYETYDRYRLEAMVADAKKQWKTADSFYETASNLTTNPAGTLNNWGYSKLTRGDYKGAEKLFLRALTYDDTMFTAKNNLMMARAGQHKYDMPVLKVTQTERARLLYTLALAAIKQGNEVMGKTLLQEAIDTNPQYFGAAVRSLKALDSNVAAG